MSEKNSVVNLRTVADRVGLAPCSVSAVLNGTPASWSIPKQTKDRVFRAAAELNYQPNFSARSLRTKRTYMVAIVSSDFGRSAVGQIVASMERRLRGRGYLLTLAALDQPSEWTRLSTQLQQRGIEGIVAVGMSLPRELQLPVVSVHLGYLNAPEALTEYTATQLAELGESTAETIISKIETNAGMKNESKIASRRTRIVPQLAMAPAVQASQQQIAAS